jgi:hypothetical protein
MPTTTAARCLRAKHLCSCAQFRFVIVGHGKAPIQSPQTQGTWRGIVAPLRSSATCTTGGWAKEQNADQSVVRAAAAHRRGQQATTLLPEMVHVCYVQSYHCVCAMCSVVHLGGDDYNSVVCGCIVAADLPNEGHATTVLSIIADVYVQL